MIWLVQLSIIQVPTVQFLVSALFYELKTAFGELLLISPNLGELFRKKVNFELLFELVKN